jgi:hypothetical protein
LLVIPEHERLRRGSWIWGQPGLRSDAISQITKQGSYKVGLFIECWKSVQFDPYVVNICFFLHQRWLLVRIRWNILHLYLFIVFCIVFIFDYSLSQSTLFETGSHYVAELVLNSQSSCLFQQWETWLHPSGIDFLN